MGGSSHGPQFRWFWGARAVSQFGDEISQLALPWLIAGVTGSALAVGVLQMLMMLPAVLLGLHIGVLADRVSRRRLLRFCDLARLVLIGSIFVVAIANNGHASVSHVMVVAFLAGVASAVFEAGAQPLVADLVPSSQLVSANSRLSLTEGIAIVLGPPVAGVLVTLFGAAETLGLDAVTFLLSFVLLSMLPLMAERLDVKAERPAEAIRVGVSFMREHAHVRALTVLQSLANACAGVVMGLIILFLQRTLTLGSVATGVVVAANGVGVVVAGLVAQRLANGIGLGRTFMAGLGLSAAGCLVVASAGEPARAIISGIGMGLMGLGAMISLIAASSYRQHVVPGHLLGRVTATSRTIFNGTIAVGALVGGLIGEFAGVRAALIVAGVFYVGVVIYALFTPLNAPDPPDLMSSAT